MSQNWWPLGLMPHRWLHSARPRDFITKPGGCGVIRPSLDFEIANEKSAAVGGAGDAVDRSVRGRNYLSLRGHVGMDMEQGERKCITARDRTQIRCVSFATAPAFCPSLTSQSASLSWPSWSSANAGRDGKASTTEDGLINMEAPPPPHGWARYPHLQRGANASRNRGKGRLMVQVRRDGETDGNIT